jgi:hypothetical protein
MGLLAAWSSDGAASTSGSTALAGNDVLAAACVAPTLTWSSGPQAPSANVANATTNPNIASRLMMSSACPGYAQTFSLHRGRQSEDASRKFCEISGKDW